MTDKNLNQTIDLLENLFEYFDNKSDVIDQGSNQIPNQAMSFCSEIESCLNKLRPASDFEDMVTEQDRGDKYGFDAELEARGEFEC